VNAALIYIQFYRASINPAFLRRATDIAKTKRQILSEIPSLRENRSSQTLLDTFPFGAGVSRRLRLVLADFMDLYKEIRLEHELPGQKTIRHRNRMKHVILFTRAQITVWVVGILIGIISGIIVYYLTKWGYI